MDNQNETNLQKHDGSKILNLAGETVYVVVKPHILTLLPRIIFAIFLGLALLGFAGLFFFLFRSLTITFLGLLTSFLVATALLTQSFVSWFYHIYIVTSRKLLEIKYTPIVGHIANEIFLDQVKCTEIDMKSGGIIYQLFNVGNVSITFDRPTHQRQFIIAKVKDYRKIGLLLTNKLINKPPTPKEKKPIGVWYKSRENPERFNYTEEISNLA